MLGSSDFDPLPAEGEAEQAALLDRAKKPRVKEGHKKSGARIKIDTTGGRQFWRRSDQYNFFRHGVPALFISEVGIEHEDYHQPTDTPV